MSTGKLEALACQIKRCEQLRSSSGFLLFWEAACRLFDLPTYFLPAPSLVLAEICAEPRWYLEHCGYTLFTTALGFGLAVLVGVIAAVGITYSKLLEKRFSPCSFR